MARRNHFKRSQQRQYKSREFKNPHIRHVKSFNSRNLAISVALLIAIVSLLSLILGHPVFAIHAVHVEGIESIDRSELEGTITQYTQRKKFLFFNMSNRFLFSSEDLSEQLMDAFALASIDIGLREGDLYLTLQERTSNLFWKTQERLYVVDLDGIVVREVRTEDEILHRSNVADLPIFIDKNDASVEIGSLVLKPEEVENAFRFLGKLEDAGIMDTYIDVDRIAGKWVRVATDVGFSIFIDLTGDTQKQFDNLVVVLSDQVKDASALEYIDLRFGDKVYFK
jgi:hypothetical protein